MEKKSYISDKMSFQKNKILEYLVKFQGNVSLACKKCNGLGILEEIDQESLIEDKNLSISRGGIIPLGTYRDIWIFKKIESILKKNKLDITTPIKKIPENVINEILFGSQEEIGVKSKKYPGTIWNTKY